MVEYLTLVHETVGSIPSTSQEGFYFVLLLKNENKFSMLIVCGAVGKTEDGLEGKLLCESLAV